MEARKAQIRAIAQAVDTDSDGFISKEDLRVYQVGSDLRGICSSDEEFAEALALVSEIRRAIHVAIHTNHDGKVRWPLRGHATLAKSRCGVGRSAWKSMWIAMSTAWKAAATPNSRDSSRKCELSVRQPGLRCLRRKNHW